MFTANSMKTLCEAMGVALPGNGTVLAMTPERIEMVKTAARRIVEMVKDENSQKWNMQNILNEKASLWSITNSDIFRNGHSACRD